MSFLSERMVHIALTLAGKGKYDIAAQIALVNSATLVIIAAGWHPFDPADMSNDIIDASIATSAKKYDCIVDAADADELEHLVGTFTEHYSTEEGQAWIEIRDEALDDLWTRYSQMPEDDECIYFVGLALGSERRG